MDFRAYKPSTWWKLAAVVVLATALLLFLFTPISTTTVTVKLDYPPGTPPPSPSDADQFEGVMKWTAIVVEAVVVLAVLGAVTWFGRRILRAGRIVPEKPQA